VSRSWLSVRGRTTLAAVVLVAVVLGAGAWVLVVTLDHQLTSSTDQVSRTQLRELLDEVAAGPLPPVLAQVNDDAVAQVMTPDGTVLAASANITGRGPITAPDGSREPRLRTFRGPDDQETETYRAWVQSGPSADGEVVAVVGTSLEAAQETSAALRTSLLVGVPLAVLVLGALVWLLVGRALGRLDRIRAEVDTIALDQLHRRIDVPGADDEVGRLAATMNRMLSRVEASVGRQRRLVADVSHDLQSPLATQRLSLELALRSPGLADTEQLRSDVLGATEEMERLVDELLVLAAADEGAPVLASNVDLDAIVLEEATRARDSGRVRIDTSRVSAGPVHGSPGELRRVVRNLVDNAVAYAATKVELGLRTTGGDVVLDVVDDGPGVPPEERELVFDRFHRGDRARTRGVPGSGLGLAIARVLTDRAGGRVDLVETPVGAHFRLVLPALPVD
jgi:signal transduction histidine kinase